MGCLTAGNDGLEKQAFIGLHIGNQVRVVVETGHQDALAWIAFWAGVIEHVEQFASFNRSDHSLETEAPLCQ